MGTTCDPLRVKTATRAATDLNAATDQKWGDKEGVMNAVGPLWAVVWAERVHAHRRLLWRVARTYKRATLGHTTRRGRSTLQARFVLPSRWRMMPPAGGNVDTSRS
eukprot:scaffold80233_cov92-Phaeocystis_antarctica.AAC.1